MERSVQITITITIIASHALAIPLIPNYNNRNGGLQEGRLSLLDWQSYSHAEPQGPGTYAFGYDIEEPQNDNVQFRHEEKHSNGSVTGSYGFVTPDGKVHITNYIADILGYRASAESRRRGFGKPVKVNVEQDIKEALAAVNYVRKSNPPRLYSNRQQDYKTVSNYKSPTKNFEAVEANSFGNYKSNPNPSYIQDKYKIFSNGATPKVHFPN